MTGGWISLHTIFKQYEDDAARWMSERDERLRTSTDVEEADRRRRRETEPEDDR
jgi:hypothetical protein